MPEELGKLQTEVGKATDDVSIVKLALHCTETHLRSVHLLSKTSVRAVLHEGEEARGCKGEEVAMGLIFLLR